MNRWAWIPGLGILASGLLSTGCASIGAADKSRPPHQPAVVETGMASWYGAEFQGRPTASGEVFDMNGISAAHRTLPFGTLVRVRNLDNGLEAEVRINDRGPFVRGRILDLSRGAARRLGMVEAGVAKIELRILERPAVVADARPADGVPWLQVGAFRERERAEALAAELNRRQKGARVYSDGTWNRVQFRSLPDRRSALELEARLGRRGYDVLLLDAH